MLELDGLLSESASRSPFGPRLPSVVGYVQEALDRAADEDDVVGLLLRIRSPGGTAAASETLLHAVQEWKAETGRPVVAHMQGIAASGGYYVSMAADHVVAHPTTITGSIGVMFAGLNFSGLMEKVGVANQTFTSGAYKDTGSPFRTMREDERLEIQRVIDDLHGRFRQVVDAGRPGLDAEAVARLADGRIYTAPQALEAGLIDQVGYLDDSVGALEERAGIGRSRVIVYHRPSEYRENLYTRSGYPALSLDLDVIDLDRILLPAGFYYVWPPALSAAPLP
jgi:protease-4